MVALTRIPLSEPSLGDLEATYLRQCIEENWVAAKGRFVNEFEDLFASIHSRDEAVSTNTGTAALHLAMLALGLGPGDEVLVPALTFVASANIVRYVGAAPIFVDVDPHTYTIDPDAAQANITERTRAIIVVHLYGHPADMDAIAAIAEQHGLAVVEDATEALGSRYRGKLCGTFGNFGCFSFNGNKVITTGGGGMVLASDPAQLMHIRHLSLQARVPGSKEYLHDEVGFNYALSNLQAAVGLAQLERIEELVAHKRVLATRYSEALADARGLRFSIEAPWSQSNYWLMSVLVDEIEHGRSRSAVIDALGAARIDARPFFKPLPTLSPYGRANGNAFPTAMQLHSQGVSIPSSSSLGVEQQQRVIAALLDHG